MITSAYSKSVRFSEHNQSKTPLSSGELSAREKLVQQVLFRDQVQTAIHHLIRSYEVSTGRAVTRLDYDARDGRITLEALPL